MKVAFHIDQLWFSAPGGIGTYVRELAPAMLDEDPTLELLPFRSRFSAGGPPEAWLTRLPPVTVVDRPIRALYPRWNLTGHPSLPAGLAQAAVVHATNPVAVAPKQRGQRLVVTVHDLAFVRHPGMFPRDWRMLYRAGLRAVARRADAVVVPSAFTADELREHSGVDPARVHVTPLAASLPVEPDHDVDATLERLGVPRPYVLSVGTLEPRKNQARLVRAYRRLAGEGRPHALVLNGPDGWLDDELRQELAAEGPGRVVRTRDLGAHDLDALYRGAEVFAYVSLYEGFGLPVVEALARGVPTVAADATSIPEVTGDAALLVDPRDEEAIGAALARVIDDPTLAADLRGRGRERASAFSWPETARATLRVYRHVAGAR
ncbi:MAG: glycosyltransferase family 4 protein [Actinomycetota bacterium]